MQLRMLGVHQGEARGIRFMSMMIDNRLVIDAGGLTSALTLEEQVAVEALLLTHPHLDHIKDLPMFAYNVWAKHSLQVYCTEPTETAIRRYFFNDAIWPDMTVKYPGVHPVVFNRVEASQPFDLLGYRISPIEMPHAVPTVGFGVARDGKTLFYTADTRGHGEPPWAALRPDLLLIESTMKSASDEAAAGFYHMTPVSIGRELRAFHALEGYYPKTVCVHINPHHEAVIVRELVELAQELGADITAAYEDMVIDI